MIIQTKFSTWNTKYNIKNNAVHLHIQFQYTGTINMSDDTTILFTVPDEIIPSITIRGIGYDLVNNTRNPFFYSIGTADGICCFRIISDKSTDVLTNPSFHADIVYFI